MPAVARGNQHGIHICPLSEELTQITIDRAILVAVFSIHDFLGRFAPAFHVDQQGELVLEVPKVGELASEP